MIDRKAVTGTVPCRLSGARFPIPIARSGLWLPVSCEDRCRPIQPEAARAQVLASLASVDAVVLFEEDTPMSLIETARPDVLIKGADYSLDEVVGGEFVRSYGGTVLLAEIAEGYSTTKTIAKMAR